MEEYLCTVVDEGKTLLLRMPDGTFVLVPVKNGMRLPNPSSALKRCVARAMFPRLSGRAGRKVLQALLQEDRNESED